MKHLKKFEKYTEYERYDYVLYRIHYDKKTNSEHLAYITGFNPSVYSQYKYRINYIENNKISSDTCNNDNIIRKLTPEEIDQYQMIQNASKYNV